MNSKTSTAEVRKYSTRNLAIWTVAWTLGVALATFGAIYLWDNDPTFSIIAIIITTLLGIGMIRANIKFLMSQDELQRKIMMDAMGIALGTALVGGISYSMLDTTNVISQDAEISYLIILIGVSYMVSILIGNARYK
ncbi:hypothetical protein [Christiangramia sp. SM2212]|uniref:Uncharacterized protein n=1 Tax=Christiangramia sediminicola TaxID=3073267 RepID=A0ABU1ENC6_9FLAO|nr:hypothetical protein [Christiangramia sp. SM2212]MDR5589890.1 hypothetical protein [Christiangramia sp. SM2212]